MRRPVLAAAAAIAVAALAGCSTTASGSGSGSDGQKADSINVMVPADPGGGWDQTGRAMSAALTGEKIVGSAPVTNITGAGGTVGLSKLANERDPWSLLVMGLVMVGAVETNDASVRIEDTTPIARLTEEALVVVVPKDSKYDDLGDLVDDVKKNGQKVTITGGSAGGADQILAGLLLEDAGLKGSEIAEKLNYVPNSGGGEAVSLILGGNVSAGISGVGEFAEHVESGDMRALAVSSEEPVELLPDVPTIQDAGYDVTLTNWRGVVAPKGITDEQRAELERVVDELHASKSWTDEVKKRGWTDAYLSGKDFDEYLAGNIAEVKKTLKNIGLVA